MILFLYCRRQKVPRTFFQRTAPVAAESDGHDLLLLFVHAASMFLTYLSVSFWTPLPWLLLVVLGQLAGLLHGLGLIHSVAADVAHGDLGLLAQLGTSLASCLRRSSVGAGKFRRMVWPSSMGLMPTSLARMALVMARSRVRSQGVMVRVRASATATGPPAGWAWGATVVVHGDLVQNGGVGAACADGGQLVVQMVDAALHFFFKGFGVCCSFSFLLK